MQVPAKRIQAWCQNKGDIPYFETSAKEAINVNQAFQTIAQHALQQEFNMDSPVDDLPGAIVLNQTSEDLKSGSGCSC